MIIFFPSRFGICRQKAQQYKMNYSMPTTNQTIPMPLIGRSSSLSDRYQKKGSLENGERENFV